MEEKGGKKVFLEEEKWSAERRRKEMLACSFWEECFWEESLVLGNLGTGDRGDTLWVWD